MDKRETRRFEIGGKYTDAWYQMTASPSAEGITVLGTEITENKKIEEALREADQRKNEFLAVLSHELRNPLAPIGTAFTSSNTRRPVASRRNARRR